MSMVLCLLLISDGTYDFSVDGTDHLFLTLQVVENQSISFRYYHLGATFYDGRYYSLRAPGYSFFAVPFYVLFKLFGGSIRFSMKFVSALSFSLNTLVVFELGKLIYNKRIGLIGSLLFVFGTFALEYGIRIWAHSASALFVTLTLYCLFRFRSSGKFSFLFFAAISTGLTFAMRYADSIILIPVLAYLLVSEKENIFKGSIKTLGLYFLVLILSVTPVLFYHWVAFDNPLATGYSHPRFEYESPGILYPENIPRALWTMFFIYRNIDDPTWNTAYHSSLIESSPFFILSFFGFFYSYKKKKTETITFIITVVAFAIYYGMRLHWWGGFCFNMRYLTPLLPIFCLTSALAISKISKNFLKEFNTEFVLGSVLTVLLLVALVFLLPAQFYFVFVEALMLFYDKKFTRYPPNQINFAIALMLLLSFVFYLLLIQKNFHEKYISLARGLFFGVLSLSLIFSAILNIYLNIILYPNKNGRVLPFLDAVGKLFGIDVPGYFFYQSITSVPLLYYGLFSLFFIGVLISLFDLFIGKN
ncbi:MAG: glycosyltransferase family 39 protein [Promethearchaeota archaeon]